MCAPALHETLLDDSRCWRDQLSSAGYGVKMALGLVFVAIGALVLSGFDKAIETALVNASPQWLTDLTTRFYKNRCLSQMAAKRALCDFCWS
jgi:hypothetical protein